MSNPTPTIGQPPDQVGVLVDSFPCKTGDGGHENIVRRGAYEYAVPCPECVKRAQSGDTRIAQAFEFLDPEREVAERATRKWFKRLETRPDTTGCPEAGAALRAWVVDHREAPAVVLCGPSGRGKSFLAAHALVSSVKKHGHSGIFLPESVYLDAFRRKHNPDVKPEDVQWANSVLDAALSRSVVVLDDFGLAHELTASATSALEALVCRRYDTDGAMIVTSNLDLDALVQKRGPRVVSRLREMASGRICDLRGKDWRA